MRNAIWGLTLLMLSLGAAFAQQPMPSSTTTTNGTIAVTNTFQTILTATRPRLSCTMQNTGTNTQFVYFGTLANATLSNSFRVSPGQTISCAVANGIALTDAVNITGTAGDGYVMASQ